MIQFQPDRLHFNWRRRERGQPYPRYPEMIAGFEKCFNEFDAFVAEQGLGFVQPVAFELTYLNHVTADDGWKSAADLPKILRDFCWKAEGDRFLPIPASVFWQAAFQLPNNTGLLVAKLNEAVRTQDEARVLVLELSARGLNPDKSTAGLRDWFDQAHVWIVNGFADLTMLDIQKTNWGRER